MARTLLCHRHFHGIAWSFMKNCFLENGDQSVALRVITVDESVAIIVNTITALFSALFWLSCCTTTITAITTCGTGSVTSVFYTY